MRHRKGGFKLNRTASHRKALFRNLLTELFRHERIRTTSVKAKAIKPLADKLVTLARRGDIASRRRASKYLFDQKVLKKLFDELAPAFKTRDGGYTRIYKVGFRRGDSAEVSLIELITGTKKGVAAKSSAETTKEVAGEKDKKALAEKKSSEESKEAKKKEVDKKKEEAKKKREAKKKEEAKKKREAKKKEEAKKKREAKKKETKKKSIKSSVVKKITSKKSSKTEKAPVKQKKGK